MSIAQTILQRYSVSNVGDVEYLGGAGGFSGAQIWKVTSLDGAFCLRRWPLSHPNRERLDWINLVLVQASSNGCPFVATPIESISGERYVQASGFFWELAPWMPGAAMFELDSNEDRLQNVMICLARFHLASAQVNLGFQNSENATTRLAALKNAGELVEAIQHTKVSNQSVLIGDLRQIVLEKGAAHAVQLANVIAPFSRELFPVQPVIRDVWHDHLLFTGNELTGLVDFGAMQIDNVALDLSRVLGSLVSEQPDRWRSALETYSQLRKLSPREIEFVFALDQTAAFLSALNWLKWVLLEDRTFESAEHVEKRIRHVIRRLV